MKETGRHNLRKAIQELPEFVCEDVLMWEMLAENLRLKQRLKSNKLPEYKAPEGIWENIEKNLNKNACEKAIENLPQHTVPKDIWPGIEKQLLIGKKNKVKSIYSTLLKVAAIFILLIGSALLFKTVTNYYAGKGTISYSVEIIDDSDLQGIEAPGENPDDNHLEVICQNNPAACSTQEFIELTKQIEDLNKELEEMSKMVKDNKDPQILRYYYRLENQKVEIETKMIKLINQS